MNFFHVPSFEDHFTLKIWLKNWNMRVDKNLFKLIHKLNRYFNEELPKHFKRDLLNMASSDSLFPKEEKLTRDFRFQIYIKDDFDSKEEIQTHFYRKMHFLVYVVLVESKQNSQVMQIISSLKKFAFIKEIKSLIIIAVCKTHTGETLFKDVQNCVVLNDSSHFSKRLFHERIIPIFRSLLLEKLRELPKVDPNLLRMTNTQFADKAQKKGFNLLQAKILKLKGDISLIFGHEQNALNFFEKARQVLSLCEQKAKINNRSGVNSLKLWRASVTEAECSYLYRALTQTWNQSSFTHLEELFLQTADTYMREKEALLEYELVLKMLGFYSFHKKREQFINMFFRLRRVIVKVTTDPRIFLYIGDLAHNAGLDRMAVCSLFECFRQAKRKPELESIVYECLTLGAKIMKLDVDNYNNDYQLLDKIPDEIANVLLINLLNDNCNSRNNEKTLHFYLLLLKKNNKTDPEWIIKEITEKIIWEAPFYNFEYDVLPYIQRLDPVAKERSFVRNEMVIKEKNSKEKPKNKENNVFIYDPRLKSKSTMLNWMEQEEAEVLIYLNNPLNSHIRIDSVFLETEGVEVASFSNESILAPFQNNFELKVKVKPIGFGLMKIKGIRIRIGNLLYVNRIDSHGIGLIYKYVKRDFPYAYEKYKKKKKLDLNELIITEHVPLLSLKVQNIIPQTVFFNETFHIKYLLVNVSQRKCKGITIRLKIDYENAVSYDIHKDYPDFELDVNQSLPVSLDLFQQPKKSPPEKFQNGEEGAVKIIHYNRNYIERVYKVTLSVESIYDSNRYYKGLKNSILYFKNYRLFQFKISKADLFNTAPQVALGNKYF